ncbi:MAG TPA: beta-eliminating lyase-related protein [Pilimelia sp.]|nr:beta-eliminating lyase-related protein [Pilimelia sp.]
MVDDAHARRMAVMSSCDRIMSGVRPATMRERLASLSAMPEVDGWGDRYGDGPVAALEARVAELLGTQSALFFPTGTMAQQIALRFWAQQTGNRFVVTHPQAHVEVHERQAYASLSGLHAIWPTLEPHPPTAADITAVAEPFGSLLLELPLREAGYLLPEWSELVATVAAARDRGARVHFDGARLWESTTHLGQPLTAIAALADSVYVSFYKSLGGLYGAALAGSAELTAYARAWRHRHGGQLFQQWPGALSALTGLDTELPVLPELVRHAAVIAQALSAVPGARVHPLPPHTHQFQLWLPHPADALNEAAVSLGEQEKVWFAAGWRDGPIPGLAMAEVTVARPALEWSADDVAEVAARFLACLAAAA